MKLKTEKQEKAMDIPKSSRVLFEVQDDNEKSITIYYSYNKYASPINELVTQTHLDRLKEIDIKVFRHGIDCFHKDATATKLDFIREIWIRNGIPTEIIIDQRKDVIHLLGIAQIIFGIDRGSSLYKMKRSVGHPDVWIYLSEWEFFLKHLSETMATYRIMSEEGAICAINSFIMTFDLPQSASTIIEKWNTSRARGFASRFARQIVDILTAEECLNIVDKMVEYLPIAIDIERQAKRARL